MVRVLVTLALLGLALVSALLAAQQANAALASQAMDFWREQPSVASANAVEQYLQQANRWPDPDARFLRGRWRTMGHPGVDPQGALADLDEAADLRPTWYRPWAAMAIILARQDPADAQWRTAAAEALLRGPHETRLFVTLFPLWRLHWHFLSQAEQRVVEQLVVSTAWREPALVVELARQYGYLGTVCRLAEDNRLVRLRCVKLGVLDEPVVENP